MVSESFGWNVVPSTWMRDGQLGIGMVQLLQDPDSEQDAVDLVAADAVPDGWRHVFAGTDELGRPAGQSAAGQRVAVTIARLIRERRLRDQPIVPAMSLSGHRASVF